LGTLPTQAVGLSGDALAAILKPNRNKISVMPQSSCSYVRRRLQAVLLIALTTAIAQAQPSDPKPTLKPGNPSTIEDFKAGDATREPYQKATDLVAALQVSPGDWVADVGAGAGYYAMRLSEIVGPGGKVFAEDISSSAMGWLNARVRAFNLKNVEVVKGETNDPKLPSDRLGAVLIVDTYHHFTGYSAMLDKILHSLKPGGCLAIADYSYGEHRSQPRVDQVKLHEIDPALVRDEITKAGFSVVKCEDPFVKWVPGVGNTRASATDMWLIVAVRPK
jgi:predicted methyltransferase